MNVGDSCRFMRNIYYFTKKTIIFKEEITGGCVTKVLLILNYSDPFFNTKKPLRKLKLFL